MLPLVMLLVLLAAVTVAWLLAREPGEGVATAAAIIADIRSEGLGAYWSGEPVLHWYLIRIRGKPVGWRVTYRQGDDDGFGGGQVLIRRSPKGGATEAISSWWLNRDATRGVYKGHSLGSSVVAQDSGRLVKMRSETEARIELRDGQLNILQVFDGRPVESQAPAPPGYIPEGADDLAMALAAQRRTHALFRMIIDQYPPEGSYPIFLRLSMQYLGPPEGEPNHTVMEVTRSRRGQTLNKATYILDRDGEVLESSYEIGGRSFTETRSSEENVLKVFPNARSIFTSLTHYDD
ncbi:MAG: hypothetical protein KGY81_10315 [Phycisphaerae bacterium]|jgi:hypothetical protein|nr:hypothetical protein [Phycisphaerae bacterium]